MPGGVFLFSRLKFASRAGIEDTPPWPLSPDHDGACMNMTGDRRRMTCGHGRCLSLGGHGRRWVWFGGHGMCLLFGTGIICLRSHHSTVFPSYYYCDGVARPSSLRLLVSWALVFLILVSTTKSSAGAAAGASSSSLTTGSGSTTTTPSLSSSGGGGARAHSLRRPLPSHEECLEALNSLAFNVFDYARYPVFFTNESFVRLAQAGTYTGPSNIEEYVLFADNSGSPYLDPKYKPVGGGDLCQKMKVLPPSGDGFCRFGSYRNFEYGFNPAFANATIHGVLGLEAELDPSENKLRSVHVFYPRGMVRNFFTILATPQVRSFICKTLEACPDAWKNSGLDTEPRGSCEARLSKLPLFEEDMRYFDGNSYGCRVLHAAFASKNDKHCPHISLNPMVDINGKTKCSVSARYNVRELYNDEFLEGMLDFADEVGMPFVPRTIDAAEGGGDMTWTDGPKRPPKDANAPDVVSADPPSWAKHALDRHVLDAYPRARCNDGKPAAYYSDAAISKNNEPKRRALIYLQGGGTCYNVTQCQLRLLSPLYAGPLGPPKYEFNPYMMGVDDSAKGAMASDAWPLRLGVGGVLSNKASENPTMHDWLHVVIPYCTSDFHIGNHCGIAMNAVTDAAFSAQGKDPLGTTKGNILYRDPSLTATGYCGAHVVNAVLDHLLESYPAIREMEQVVLLGLSAGGLGVALNADKWLARLPGVDVRAVIDSSWFVSIPRAFATKNVAQVSGRSEQLSEYASMVRAFNISEQHLSAACVAEQTVTLTRHLSHVAEVGHSIHETAVGACLHLENILPHLSTPAWIVQGLYDMYALSPFTGRIDPTNLKRDVFLNSFTLLRWYESYGPLMVEALERSALRAENSHHRIFAPSCMMHGATFHDGRSLTKLLKHDGHGVSWDGTVKIRNPADTCGTIDVPAVGLDFPWLADDPFTTLKNLKINGTSAYTHMTGFLATPRESLHNPNASHLPGGILLTDLCRGLQCNPSCSAVMRLPSSRSESYRLSAFREGGAKVAVVIFVVIVIGGMAALDLQLIVLSFIRLRQWADARRRLKASKEQDNVLLEVKEEVDSSGGEMSGGGNSLASIDRASSRPIICDDLRSLLRERTFSLKRNRTFHERATTFNEFGKKMVVSTNTRTAEKYIMMMRLSALRIPFTIQLCELTYQVVHKETKGLVTILDDVTVVFRGKGMTAIMGASGCGKSTLLELIVGQRTEGNLHGMLLHDGKPLNGPGVDQKRTLNAFGYVPQHDDASMPTLTGREVLLYCAELRMPGLTRDEIVARVEGVIESMGIESFADAAIGTPGFGKRGISGGQRRRLTLASQLLHDPTYLMADEPTSGLDSSTALSICATLLKVAYEGHSILLTIHQPRPEVFQLFTRLVVMGKAAPGRGGTCVYAGSVPAAISHFARIAPNMVTDTISNPADFIIDVICTAGDELHEAIRRANDEGRKNTFAVMLHNLLCSLDFHARAGKERSLNHEASSSLVDVAQAYRSGGTLKKVEIKSSMEKSVIEDINIVGASAKLILNVKAMLTDAVMDSHRMLLLGFALARRPKSTFQMWNEWMKVTAAAHGRIYLSDLAKGLGSYLMTSYILYIGIFVTNSIIYWDPPESPSGMSNRLTMFVMVMMMPQFGKMTSVDGMGNIVMMHRMSRLAGNEHGSHFAVAYALTQSFTPWLILCTMAVLSSAVLNIPWIVVPTFLLAAVSVDAIVGAAFAAIVVTVPFDLKTTFTTLFASFHVIGSGLIYKYDDLPPLFKWFAWIMPAGPSMSLLTTQAALSYEGMQCPADPDDERSGTIDGYCNLLDGVSLMSVLTSRNEQMKWVSQHHTETMAILLCQYLFWRIVLVIMSVYMSSKKSALVVEPYHVAIIRLIDKVTDAGLDIDAETKRHRAAMIIEQNLVFRKEYHSQAMKELGENVRLQSSSTNEERLDVSVFDDNRLQVALQISNDRYVKAVQHVAANSRQVRAGKGSPTTTSS